MKGLELSKQYFLKYKDELLASIGDLKDQLCFGLVGGGSECYGFDDDISIDHDFEPAFCIFVPKDMNRSDQFRIERAYAKLPKEFMGYKRSILDSGRHGLLIIEDFYKDKISNLDYNNISIDWFKIPEHYLSEATNGEIYEDNLGLFTSIREKIEYYPEDIRLKKIASNLIMMKQSGIYNYQRCLDHNETGAAQMAIYEYVKATINVIFLLNKVYMPYYKWQFRYLKDLKILSELSSVLEYLISIDNSNKDAKKEMIEDINNMILDEIKKQNLSKEFCYDLENNAFSINNKISNEQIRNLDILYAL
ncbi:MAG: DUF4037 domain-containing protein [Bacilli bacterium]|nr:DUF4037 domain-containing protein [Bacilli bacterium]